MVDGALGYLIRQFETAWKLTNFHLDGLATEECLWRPAHEGLHVHQVLDGRWRADWPDHEGYDIGPPEHCVADVAPRLLVVHGSQPLIWRWDSLTRERDVAWQCR